MLPKYSRIPHSEFPIGAQKKKSVHSTHFSLVVFSAEIAKPKFSVVVSNKIAKKSVERNALRRRVYAALRSIGAGKAHRMYIVYAKKGAGGLSYSKIQTEVKSLFQKI